MNEEIQLTLTEFLIDDLTSTEPKINPDVMNITRITRKKMSAILNNAIKEVTMNQLDVDIESWKMTSQALKEMSDESYLALREEIISLYS